MSILERIAQKIDQADKRRLLGWTVGVLAVGGLILLIVSTLLNRASPSYNEQYVDKDTGETVSNFPNTDPEKEGQESEVVVLGLSELDKFGVAGLVPNQLSLMRTDLLENALPKLGEHENIIKVLDAKYDINADRTTASLKLSKTRTLTLTVRVKPAVSFNYTISEDSSVRYRSQEIYSDDYTGDGVPPEQQPE